MDKKKPSPLDIKDTKHAENSPKSSHAAAQTAPEDEIGGYKAMGLPEPTRYKDWEVKGRCSDF